MRFICLHSKWYDFILSLTIKTEKPNQNNFPRNSRSTNVFLFLCWYLSFYFCCYWKSNVYIRWKLSYKMIICMYICGGHDYVLLWWVNEWMNEITLLLNHLFFCFRRYNHRHNDYTFAGISLIHFCVCVCVNLYVWLFICFVMFLLIFRLRMNIFLCEFFSLLIRLLILNYF